MNLKSIIKKVDNKKVLTCILLVIVGYMTAQLFMRKVNGFNVGGQSCKCTTGTTGIDCVDSANSKLIRSGKFCTDQKTEDTCKTAGGRTFIGKNTCKWTPGPTPTPGPPGGKTPTPGPPGGKTPTPTPTPSYSCSSTSIFSADKCLKNGSVVTDPSSDDGCKDCHGILSPHKFWLWLIIVISIIVFLIIIYAIS